MKKYVAEFIGTFVLVLFGCGVAVLSKGDLMVTSLAFGLAIVACAYAFGDVSGCHVNPAVSLAMFVSKKLTAKEFGCYVISQVLGALAGSGMLYIILSNTDIGVNALGANGYGELSAYGITPLCAGLVETVLTFVFVYTILGVTSSESKSNVAPIAIGLTLTFVHLMGIKLTGTSVNPARSLAPALILGGDALSQIWVFILFPFLGALLAACAYTYLNTKKKVFNLFSK